MPRISDSQRHSTRRHSTHGQSPSVKLTDLPSVEGLSRQRHRKRIELTPGTMDAMKDLNRAIEDTQYVLDYGSGNQRFHIIDSDGRSDGRVQALRDYTRERKDKRHSPVAIAQFRAGNCGEMAEVTAALAAFQGSDWPISVVSALDMDHSYVVAGDTRDPHYSSRGNSIVMGDAWPLYGRADTKDNFGISERFEVVHTYSPNSTNREERDKILKAKDIAKNYMKIKPLNKYHLDAAGVLEAIANDGSTAYSQLTSAADISVTYVGADKKERPNTIKHAVLADHAKDAEQRREAEAAYDYKRATSDADRAARAARRAYAAGDHKSARRYEREESDARRAANNAKRKADAHGRAARDAGELLAPPRRRR